MVYTSTEFYFGYTTVVYKSNEFYLGTPVWCTQAVNSNPDTSGTKKCMGCMEAYGSEWKRRERMEEYGMVRKVYGTGIKGVCDCKQPLTILFFHNFCYHVLFKCIFRFIIQWVLWVVYALYYMI